MKIALHWFRRDLRLTDNTALAQAVEENDVVWPVFVFDPKILRASDIGAARVQFLLDSLSSLQKNLEEAGGKLLIRQGEVGHELKKLVEETKATGIYWNRDYEPYARARDTSLEKMFLAAGLTVQTYKDGVIMEPDEVLKADGTPYAVFTPYARLWRTKAQVTALGKVKLKRVVTANLASEPLPTLAKLGFQLSSVIPSGGERAALDRLKRFIGGPLAHYRSQRNFPALNGTSHLSPDLRFGTVSPRQIFVAVEKAKTQHPQATAEIEVYLNELIWREFYRAILWHFPHVAQSCFKPIYDDLKWENNERHFKAWCDGQTGFPIVDAAMRQLNQTGWMHNRLRMIVASFLTKDLLIDYKWGERYFMQKLVDGDLASNNGGWQWSASTGTDAQPYFRIFNPTSQAEKFDPEGRFIEQYIPEVNNLSYPPPIVEHAPQREKALKFFKPG